MTSNTKRPKHNNPKKWILNGFVMNTPGLQNPGLWSHPNDQGKNYKTIKYWTDLAKKLEDANFTSLFIADVLGPYDVFGGPGNFSSPAIGAGQLPVNDPSLIVPVMASVTKSIGFGITISTTYEHPYDLSRRLSTLDHLTEGRIAWNVVTSYLESAAKGHGLNEQIDKSIRYERANEYLEVIYKLLEGSWKDDAVILDTTRNIYADPTKIKSIHHKGKHFTIDGIHISEPSKQRTPVIFQAGLSNDGKKLAAKHAEGVFVSGISPESVRLNVDDIKKLAVEYDRDPDSIKFVFGVLIVVDETDAKAWSKFESYKQYANIEGALALIGGWMGLDLSPFPDDIDLRTVGGDVGKFFNKRSPNSPISKLEFALEVSVGGSPKIIGSYETVANELERYIDIGGVDGFNLKYSIVPGSFDDIIEWLLPELRKRGHFDSNYPVPEGTLRENLSRIEGNTHLPSDHPGYKFKW
ncbi:putative monooxygenase [Wickerhamomyces ciferrii]|uniref:Monooxygenase n=1 Tax=Wickerhamomyces ciferrii (strain ATCC 14091 / BCRC 22168 / CBS 111 / JCM 3599 / NBRC 0793 / NRRL Y-1031 F-60-10) TaxID=1206466 RepID=K0KWM1_WICCF|nr:putative monooxygenase [Wickerhamomyces ciferrii]CCH45528.1 putative monooxygenase [Wickerhamomyces ciferrii]